MRYKGVYCIASQSQAPAAPGFPGPLRRFLLSHLLCIFPYAWRLFPLPNMRFPAVLASGVNQQLSCAGGHNRTFTSGPCPGPRSALDKRCVAFRNWSYSIGPNRSRPLHVTCISTIAIPYNPQRCCPLLHLRFSRSFSVLPLHSTNVLT
jgi:hypothetical protein